MSSAPCAHDMARLLGRVMRYASDSGNELLAIQGRMAALTACIEMKHDPQVHLLEELALARPRARPAEVPGTGRPV